MQPTRRQALRAGAAAGAVALAAACTGHRPARPLPHPVDPQVAVDADLTRAAVAREQALLSAYGAALLEHPQLTALLTPVFEDHAAHLTALGVAPPPTPTASPAVTPAGATTPSAEPSPSGPPGGSPSSTAVLRRLAAQERSAASAHAAAVLPASPKLAPLLASLAACESSHAVLL